MTRRLVMSMARTAGRQPDGAAMGHTFVELMVTVAILLVLASAALPIASASRQREKEIELRRALREIRLALHTYHQVCRASTGGGGTVGGVVSIVQIKIEDDPDLTCYPKKLDVLVEGIETNTADYELKFLRRIPRDPFNVDDDEHDAFGWELISTTDDFERGSWDRRNVFDVRSASPRRALDGSRYGDW